MEVSKVIDYESIIAKYCDGNAELQSVLLTHSRQVADRALAILAEHPEWVESGEVDPVFVEEAAMLHDIGVVLCNAPKIYCMGTHSYIEHGYLGAEILRKEGLPKHAGVAERHTGTGITIEQLNLCASYIHSVAVAVKQPPLTSMHSLDGLDFIAQTRAQRCCTDVYVYSLFSHLFFHSS